MTATPRTTGPLRRFATRAAVFLVVLYATGCGALFVSQNSLIYPRHMIGPAPAESERPPDAEQIWITAQDGSKVEAWFVAGRGRSATSPGPCVIWLHGNGEIIDHNMEPARMYAAMGVSTLLPEYRGYGRSTGSPGQEPIMEDLRAFRELLLKRPDVDPNSIIYHGESLGTGFACALAAEHPPRAMVLNSPFTSMTAMAGKFLVPGFLVSSPLRSDAVLKNATWPVLIFHGTSDEVIPISHGRDLAELTPGAQLIELDCGHNDLPPSWSDYRQSIASFLSAAGVPVE